MPNVHIMTEAAYREMRRHFVHDFVEARTWITADRLIEILNNPAKYDGQAFVLRGGANV